MVTNELLEQFAETIASKVATRLQNTRRPDKRLLTVKEAATYLGRSVGALHHLSASGEVPTVRNGRRVHFDTADLDRWIESNRISA